jgi:hypothetical protein
VALDFDRFRSEPIFRSTAPVQELMADLVRLKGFDAEMETRQALWSKRGRLSLILALVSFFSLFVIGPMGLALVSFGLIVAFLVAYLVCSIRSSRFNRLNLDDRRYELVLNLLQRLRKDIAPAEPVTVELDFHPRTDKRNLTDRRKVGTWKAEFFVQRWLSLQARMLDGTHLRLGMEERLQLRTRSKTNRRGRVKTKTKLKGMSLLQAQLRVKPEKHPELSRLAGLAKQAVRLPKGVKLVRLEVTAERLSLRSRMSLDWKPREAATTGPTLDASRTYLTMLLSLYQVLNYSASLRKRDAVRIAS